MQIGTVGHAIVDEINHALQDWSVANMRTINYVLKGQNCLTEMYSAIEAEVPVPTDPNTQKNEKLLKALFEADKVILVVNPFLPVTCFSMRD
jgi:nicotinamidase/pyrazinamidase